MELKEFIKDALINIIQAVDEAQDEIKGQPHAINPQTTIGQGKESKYVQNVEFDVAIQVAKEERSGGQAKLMIPIVDVGLEGGKESKDISSTASRIKFTIPVAFAYIEKNIKKGVEIGGTIRDLKVK